MTEPANESFRPTEVPDDDDEVLDDTIEEDATRPRFTGKKRQWLNYTQEARDASTSLERLEDADLATHLYNAHRLKRRRLDQDDPTQRVRSHVRKERWGPGIAEGNGIIPKTSWTAWPLEPDRLPSPEIAVKSRLSNDAEGILHGTVDEQRKPSSDLEDCLLSEILRQARESFYARQAYGRAHPEDKDELQAADDTVEPVVVADEEHARRISQPVIRHIIARFEKLLQALHASRKGHIRLRSSADSATEDTSGGETSRSRSRSVSTHQSSIAARIRATPRDWSEVLGIAAMTGWKPEALRSTYLRCEELFDESMGFTSLTARGAEGIVPLDMSMPMKATEESEVNRAGGARAAAIADLCCPYEDCTRHYEPYPLRWRLTEHLKRTHGEKSHSNRRRPVLPEDEIYGGIHLDGFLQPIDLPRRPSKRRRSMTDNPIPATSLGESSERSAAETRR